MKTLRWIVTLLIATGTCWRAGGQTMVDLSRQGKLASGTALPVRCTVGQVFFKTDAPGGANLYACADVDTWTVVGLPILSGDVVGNQQSLTVTGIQNRGINAAAPADREVLRWNAAAGQWEPGAVLSTGTAAPPVSCSTGSLYLQSDPGSNIQQLYICSNTDTWSMSSFRSGTLLARPPGCVAGQVWLSIDTGILSYCSATGNPGTWSTTAGTTDDIGPGAMSRTMPNAVNSTVDIGTFSADSTEASATYEIYISTHGSGGNINKSYRFSIEKNMSSNTWRTVAPVTSTGPDGGQDWDLEAYPTSSASLQLRLRRTLGSGTPTASVAVYRYAGGTYTFTPSTAVNTGVTVTAGMLSTSVLTQQDGSVFYNGSLIIPVTGTPAVGYVPTATSATTAAWAAPPFGGGGGTGNAANPVTTTFSATPSFSCGSPTAGTITTFKLSTPLTANITSSTLSGCTSGQLLAFILTQDGTGGRTFAAPSGFDPITINPLANVTTTLLFQWDGSAGRLVNSSNDSGYIYMAAAAVPGTPPPGTGVVYFDSTSKNLAAKNDAGVIKHGVQSDSGAANNYIAAIADDGTVTKSRPSCATLSDAGPGCNAAGVGDASTNASFSIDSELAVFSGTGGKTIKRAMGDGYVKLAAGVMQTPGPIPGTDLPLPTTTVPGGVVAKVCGGTDKLSGLGTDGILVCSADQTSGGVTLADKTRMTSCTFDGGGSAITANATCTTRVPVAGTIVGWAIEALGASPACTIDVLRIASGSTLPTSSIAAGALPALTSTANAAKSSVLTGWTTSLAADDIVTFKVITPGAATWAAIHIYYSVN